MCKRAGGEIVWVRYINGWELIKEIAEGKIKEGSRFNVYQNDELYFSQPVYYEKEVLRQDGVLLTEFLSFKNIVSLEFEPIEGDIKELPELTSNINYDTYSIENNRHKINELVRAVNKMRKNT